MSRDVWKILYSTSLLQDIKYIGNIYQLEIDFIVEKINTLYIQDYLLHSEEVIAREYGGLEKIKDNWPKWVVSLDEMNFPTKNGILHLHAWELAERL